MPLFRANSPSQSLGKRAAPNTKVARKPWKEEEDGCVQSLSQLCLWSVADNMKRLWVKDYAENYLDKYDFIHIMGPFNVLPGELVEELTCILSSRGELSRAAAHLLLVPQLRSLSLRGFPGLVTPSFCTLIAARCQALTSLDLSSTQQLPAKPQCELLRCLPSLYSLSLAGTPCDSRVLMTIAQHCRALRHLDVSRCHLLSPAGLLPLGQGGGGGGPHPTPSTSGWRSSAPSGSSSASCPHPFVSTGHPSLCSLLALDIGFGEGEGDPAAAAAFLLLTLPRLQRLALEGLGQACELIHQRDFRPTAEFTSRKGLPCLEELWRGRGMRHGERREVEEDDDEMEGAMAWDECEDEGGREGMSRDEGARGVWSGTDRAQEPGGQTEMDGAEAPSPESSHSTLQLKDAQGLTPASLEAVGHLCPHIHTLSLHCDEVEGRTPQVLARGLQVWAGQLRSLTLCFQGMLAELLPALHVAGPSLFSLTLEGLQCSPYFPLLKLFGACPRLRNLHVHAGPTTTMLAEGDEDEEEWNGNPPCLPELRSLSLKFDYEQDQMIPAMSWPSLVGALTCLLCGSPLLEKLTLVAVPCCLDLVFLRMLGSTRENRLRIVMHQNVAPGLLAWLREMSLAHSDVSGSTVRRLIGVCGRLKSLDLTGCWGVHRSSLLALQRASRRRQSVTITWE